MVIVAAKIELGEEHSALELIEQLFVNRDRKFVPDHLEVQCAIIHTEAP